MKITVINYGLSNLLSVERALTHLGAEAVVTDDPAEIRAAKALILPGVGAFEDGMKGLHNLGITPVLLETCRAGTPLLGICLGMQMLFEESEEFGLHKGLGLIPGRVEKIPSQTLEGAPQRVPHISWNGLYPPEKGVLGKTGDSFAGTVLEGLTPGQECYFVHSYEGKPANPAHRLADTWYGGRRICAAVQNGSVIGTQFHPEKSGPMGLGILKRYLETL